MLWVAVCVHFHAGMQQTMFNYNIDEDMHDRLKCTYVVLYYLNTYTAISF